MSTKQNILGVTKDALVEFFTEHGGSAYHAGEVLEAVYKKSIKDFNLIEGITERYRALLAVLAEIDEAKLNDNVQQREKQIRDAIAGWNLPALSELRGKGLMLGFALNADALVQKEGVTPALNVVLKLTELGLLTVLAGAETLRWLPPLNVTEEEVSQALDLLKQALTELSV